MMEFEFPKRNLDVDFDDDTGFPFDDQRLNTPQSEPSSSSQPPTSSTGYPVFGARGDDSRLHFDDHLRDIAARYPEFADHIRPGVAVTASAFPRERVRRDPWGRDEFDFGRDFDIPAEFESRFARPREFYPPNTQTYSSSPPCQPESRPPTHPQTTPPPPAGSKPAQTQTHPQIASNTPIPATAACRAATAATTTKHPTAATGQGIQQSNTVDLGQVQPHSAAQGAAGGGGEFRGQRSMSAPPTDGGRAAAGGKRYVSSIQIPVLQQGSPQRGAGNQLGGGSQSAEMGASNSTPKQPPPPQPVQHTPNRPNEYVIPIHIEGRDEPITPKQHYQPPASNSQQYTQPPPSGQNQPLFTAMKDQFSRQQEQVQKEQQQKYQEQQQKNQEQQQRDFEQQEKAQIVKPTPLEMIQLIQKDVSELMSRVDRFAGRPKDKEYGYLDEMLTRNLLKLDNIETNGKDAIRRARREAIKCIEGCISILEAKANANVANETALLALEDKSGNKNADGAVEYAERAMEEGQDNGGDRKEAAADVSVT